MKNKRMPAEWENPSAILMAYPTEATDWNYILDEARAQFDSLITTLLETGETVLLLGPDELRGKFCCRNSENLHLISDVVFNDTWTRDYGPITVEHNGMLKELDFGFNGWGLKFASDLDNLVNLHLVQVGHLDVGRYENHRDFTLEGGSIESDGKGTVLTTTRCLCSPNRNGGKRKEEIEVILGDRLGAERVLWLDFGFLEGDDTDSHIDTLARLAPGDTIIYVAPPTNREDIHFEELTLMERQLKELAVSSETPEKKYRLIPLPFPDPIYDEEGQRLPATYANYLVTASNLFIPIYGQPEKDREAVMQIASAFPTHNVYTVDCRTLIRQHGSLHCSTMQIY